MGDLEIFVKLPWFGKGECYTYKQTGQPFFCEGFVVKYHGTMECHKKEKDLLPLG